MVKNFKELTFEYQNLAGGKGGKLAKMFQDGYPVPEGFVILPSAFQKEKLNNEARSKIKSFLDLIRRKNKSALFAVRSSALSEDSNLASFAGEFETVLHIETDEEVFEAIDTVFRSRQSERVKVYSSVQGIDQSHDIAVIVQLMIPSEISGVLFTADPITGSFVNMIGNYVYDVGEQLVSGETNAYDFKLKRPNGKYDGPNEFKKYAKKLYRYAVKIEKEFGSPQDIEWAVAKGKLYILQTRPITTLSPGNPDTYEWNYSFMGDYLWSNVNVGEAISDVVTPFTWSILEDSDEEQSVVPGFFLWGNICGRMYSNISQLLVVGSMFGNKRAEGKISEIYGMIPEGIDIPIYPFSRLNFIKEMIPKFIRNIKNRKKASKDILYHLRNNPNWCRKITERIRNIKTDKELLSLWKEEYKPYNSRALWISIAGAMRMVTVSNKLSHILTKLVGKQDANVLLSNLRGSTELASLGPVIGIAKVVQGEMSREEYLLKYGHRGPHELELSIQHPAEDKDWLERRIAEFKKSNTDVEELLQKQQVQYEHAFRKFSDCFPHKVKWLEKQIAIVSNAAQIREATRSEFVRVLRVIRAFALKAGELTGIGNDVFFLYIDEVEKLLSGGTPAVKYISVRKENYNKYKSLPRYPSVIRGNFNPFEWVKDPNRRGDYYDSTMPIENSFDIQILKGCAGSAGRVEGIVRIVNNPEEGEKLQLGEILVATTTNVGWTPLFPKVAAIITDVGAPLSHATIVAREMGIPAVVGCGNATTRLKTGDRVLVDGGHGTVHIFG
ncbi:PEP/pyruvate-binding domain-containing protein [Seinonella peptonophila]|nr:PEP/pyruvate-binding domain-containing protein [Seinonella peptonophila]